MNLNESNISTNRQKLDLKEVDITKLREYMYDYFLKKEKYYKNIK